MEEDDVDSSSEKNTTTGTYVSSEDFDFDESNTTEMPPEIVKICVNSTVDKSQPKELQFVRNIVF